MWRINDLYAATPAHPAERISVIALNHLDRVAARAQEILASNRQHLDSVLDEQRQLDVFRPEYGTIVFPRLQGGKAEEFMRLLRDEYETSVVPGRFFDMPDYFRIGIGGEPEMTREGLERLRRALEQWR